MFQYSFMAISNDEGGPIRLWHQTNPWPGSLAGTMPNEINFDQVIAGTAPIVGGAHIFSNDLLL
jgi:hypothetical protein